MSTGRQLSILLLLQAHGRLTARDLARRLEVSQRTVHRDMDALSAAGVPIYAQRGGGGGWSLLDQYRTDITGLTELEAQALFAAPPSPALHDVGLGHAAEEAFLKLRAALPARRHPGAAHARQRLYVDGAGWGQRTGSGTAPPHLHVLQEAIWHDRKLRIAYELSDDLYDPRPPEIVERLVDPLGLVAKGRSWYLVAAPEHEPGASPPSGPASTATANATTCAERTVRAYRVSRIREAEILDRPCMRPPDFDLAEYWERSTAAFKANVPRYDVTVRVAAAALALVRKSSPYRRAVQGSLRHSEGAPAPPETRDADGWITLPLRFEVEEEAIPYLLRFGGDLEVLTPRTLRQKVAALAAAAAARYLGDAPLSFEP